VCCCLICSTFCGSGFFAAATFVVVLWETDGAALADAVVAGVVVAPAAGVVLAVVVGGVVLAGVVAGVVGAADTAGLVVVVAAAGLDVAFVFGVEAGLMLVLALGVVLAFAAGVFAFLSFRRD